MRSLKLILLFILFSPGQGDVSDNCQNERTEDRDKLIRADKASFAEYYQYVRQKANTGTPESPDQSNKGFGFLAGDANNEAPDLWIVQAQLISGHSRPAIAEQLLRYCYRSKSNPDPENHA